MIILGLDAALDLRQHGQLLIEVLYLCFSLR
jgi:hypothetical protein